MTDKEKIRAEIERRMKASAKIEEEYKGIDKDLSAKAQLKAAEYQSMLIFIDSMQEEPVSEDLEKELKQYFVNNHMQVGEDNRVMWAGSFYPNLITDFRNIARHFADWQKQQIMKNAMEVEIIEPSSYSIIKTKNETPLYGHYGDEVKVIII